MGLRNTYVDLKSVLYEPGLAQRDAVASYLDTNQTTANPTAIYSYVYMFHSDFNEPVA